MPGGVDNPYVGDGHLAHAIGTDIDLGLCYSDAHGDGSNKAHRVYGEFLSGSIVCYSPTIPAVLKTDLDRIADFYDGVNGVHPNETAGTHYHIRFP